MTSSMSGYNGPAGSGNFGNAAGSFKEKLPKGYKAASLQQFSPEQMQLFQQLFSHVSPNSYLSRLASGDQSFFEEMEAPAHRQFQEELGQLGSRFSNAGMGARRGSGFQNASTQATSDFAQQLQSQRQGLQRQAIQDLLGIGESLLAKRPYEQFLVPKQRKPSFLQSIFGGVAPLAGAGIGGYFGGSEGAKLGGSLGSAFGQAFM